MSPFPSGISDIQGGLGVPLVLDSTPPTPKPSEDGDNDNGEQVVADLSSQGGELRRGIM